MNLLAYDFILPHADDQRPVLFVTSTEPSLATLAVARLLDLVGNRKLHVLTSIPGVLSLQHPKLVTHSYPKEITRLSLDCLPRASAAELKSLGFSMAIYAERQGRDWISYRNVIMLLVKLGLEHVYSVTEAFCFSELGTLFCFRPFKAGDHTVDIAGISLMDPDERELLYQLAYSSPGDGDAVEIGSYAGGSTIAIAFALQDKGSGTVTAIDTDPRYSLEADLEKHGVAGNVRLLKMASRDVAGAWRLLSGGKPDISLLYIDGDHSYESCRMDIAHWAPYLIRGGTICFHDYSDACGCSGVIRAVHEAIILPGEYENYRLVNKMFVATKKRR